MHRMGQVRSATNKYAQGEKNNQEPIGKWGICVVEYMGQRLGKREREYAAEANGQLERLMHGTLDNTVIVH